MSEDTTTPDPFPSKLEAFIKRNGIKPVALARECQYSRQHVLRIRKATEEPSRKFIKAVTLACRRLSRKHVSATQLFDLG